MQKSLKLGRIAGVRLSVHWTFLILLIWIFYAYYKMENNIQQAWMGVLLILALFVCVTLHELGHALAAKSFKIKTKSITLLPIGGLAQMEKMPEKPSQELWVALAGPLVNVVISVLLYTFLIANNGIPSELSLESLELKGMGFWLNLLIANIVLAVFNLIPAFPMDGGRVLRALLSYKYERGKATKIAAGIGQFLAIFFIFIGFYYNFWLIFIGLFVYLGAEAEAKFEITKSLLAGYTVNDVLMKEYTSFNPSDTLEEVVQHLLNGQDQEFIVMDSWKVVGVICRKDLISGLSKYGKNSMISSVMRKDFVKLDSNMSLNEVYLKLIKDDCSVAPVIDNENLSGIIDRENIHELIMIDTALKTTAST